MSYSEEYARSRVKNSPLQHSALSLPSSLPVRIPQPTVNISETKALDIESFKYIQNMIAVVIIQVKLKDRETTLKTICDVIASEARCMEAIGIDYIMDYVKEAKFKLLDDPEEAEDFEDLDSEDDDIDIEIEETEEEGEADANNKT